MSSLCLFSFLRTEWRCAVRDLPAVVCLSTWARFSLGWCMTTCSLCLKRTRCRTRKHKHIAAVIKVLTKFLAQCRLRAIFRTFPTRLLLRTERETDLFVSKELFFISYLVSFKYTPTLRKRSVMFLEDATVSLRGNQSSWGDCSRCYHSWTTRVLFWVLQMVAQVNFLDRIFILIFLCY